MCVEPKISVVMPVYNTEKYLRRSIESVINQDMKEWELVITNNGSTDSSDSIIDEYVKMDSRIRKFVIPHADYPKTARDYCICQAVTNWIVALDSDDCIETNCLSTMYQRALETNADLIIQEMCLVDTAGNIIHKVPDYQAFDKNTVIRGAEDAVRLTLNGWKIGANGALIKKSLYTNLSTLATGDFERYTDEYDTRIHLYNASKVAFCDCKYYYYIYPTSTVHQFSMRRIIYPLATNYGLCDFIEEKYSIHSLEYKLVMMQTYLYLISCLRCSLRLWSKFNKFSDIERKQLRKWVLANIERIDSRELSLYQKYTLIIMGKCFKICYR